ncbi:MAG: DUF4097 family beta strand repeat-containing protein [Gemmatimonadota bacterium]
MNRVPRALSLAAGLLLSSVALGELQAQPARPVLVREALAADASIRINGAFVSLRIVGWARDSIVITGNIPKGARFDGGVAARGVGGSLPRGAKFYVEQQAGQPTAALEMFVPSRARVWAKAPDAQIDVSGPSGSMDLNIIGGSITVTSSPAELNIESMDGSVTVVGSPAWMRVKTASGDVTVRGSSEDAAITSVSGTLRISDGRFDRVRLETVTGNVVWSADQVRAGTLTVDTHSGGIEFLAPSTPGADVDAITITGRIENGLSSRKPIAGRQGRGEELALQMGQGESRTVLRSFKGNIRLAWR